MSYYGNFTTHKVVEMNQSTGLRTGHMVAQTRLDVTSGNSFDNGYILALDVTKDALKLAEGNESRVFIHFTEEYQPIMKAGLKYFSVPLMERVEGQNTVKYCYPRAIAIYENDAWTTDNFNDEDGWAKEGTTWAEVVDGVLTLTDEKPEAGKHIFLAKKTTLPDGVTEAAQFIYVGRELAAAAAEEVDGGNG